MGGGGGLEKIKSDAAMRIRCQQEGGWISDNGRGECELLDIPRPYHMVIMFS